MHTLQCKVFMIDSSWKINKAKKLLLSGYCQSYKGHVKRFLIRAFYPERLKISMTHVLFKLEPFQLCQVCKQGFHDL